MSEYLKRLILEGQESPDQVSPEALEKILEFYEIILRENQEQNLTRLTEPEAFYWSNIKDVFELLKTGWIQYPAVDLGSGAGIPGLLAALIEPKPWILVESERRKAEYLESAVKSLGLSSQISVKWARVEEFLAKQPTSQPVGSVVSRAVGTAERIYGWIGSCSTWNNLILFKGPKWDEEWVAFNQSRHRNRLVLSGVHQYQSRVGAETSDRKIVLLERKK